MENFDEVMKQYAIKVTDKDGLEHYKLTYRKRVLTHKVGSKEDLKLEDTPVITTHRPIMTPFGAFNSVKEAAIYKNMSASYIYAKIKSKPKEYYYENQQRYNDTGDSARELSESQTMHTA